VSSKEKTSYCKFTYKITTLPPGSIICSRNELSEAQLSAAQNHTSKTFRLYPNFIKESKLRISSKLPKGVGVIVLTVKEMNTIFLDAEPAQARYFPLAGIIYLTEESFTAKSLDWPHELAHLINYHSGITNEALDEAMAYAFEVYYVKR
jgi:hypothetical protein